MTHRKILALLVTLLLPWGLSAQTNPNKGGLGLDQILSSSKSESKVKVKGMDALQGKVQSLEEGMAALQIAFETAGQTPEQTENALDQFAARLKGNIQMLGPTGDIGKMSLDLLKKSEAEAKSLRARSLDPKLSPSIRAVYAQTADRFDDQIAQLYQTSEILRSNIRNLQTQLKSVEERKDLYVALIRVDSLEQANNVFILVTQQVGEIVVALDDLGNRLPGTTVKPE